MLQRVRDLAVAVQQRHAVEHRTRPRSPPRSRSSAPRSRRIGADTKFNGIALLTGTGTDHLPGRRRRRRDDRRLRRAAVRLAARASTSTRRSSPSRGTRHAGVDRHGDPERRRTPAATFGSVQNRLEHTLNNLANYEENLTGVREPDPGRRHGVGDGQLHEAADPAAGRHVDARPGEPAPAVGALAPARLAQPTLGWLTAPFPLRRRRGRFRWPTRDTECRAPCLAPVRPPSGCP